MRVVLNILFCTFFLVLSFYAKADNGSDMFIKANELYSAEDYTAAIEAYNNILETGHESAALHYNLGNAYYKFNQLGEAILHYEKAALLSPYDEDIQFNLKIARQHTIDNISEIKPFFLARWWAGLRDSFSSNTWCIIGVSLFWIGIGGLIFWLIGQTRTLKKQGFLAGISAVVLSLFILTIAWQKSEIESDSGFAIIFKEQVALKNAPDNASGDILTLHEGTKVELLDKIGEWYKVRLMNGEQGWMEVDVVEKI